MAEIRHMYMIELRYTEEEEEGNKDFIRKGVQNGEKFEGESFELLKRNSKTFFRMLSGKS